MQKNIEKVFSIAKVKLFIDFFKRKNLEFFNIYISHSEKSMIFEIPNDIFEDLYERTRNSFLNPDNYCYLEDFQVGFFSKKIKYINIYFFTPFLNTQKIFIVSSKDKLYFQTYLFYIKKFFKYDLMQENLEEIPKEKFIKEKDLVEFAPAMISNYFNGVKITSEYILFLLGKKKRTTHEEKFLDFFFGYLKYFFNTKYETEHTQRMIKKKILNLLEDINSNYFKIIEKYIKKMDLFNNKIVFNENLTTYQPVFFKFENFDNKFYIQNLDMFIYLDILYRIKFKNNKDLKIKYLKYYQIIYTKIEKEFLCLTNNEKALLLHWLLLVFPSNPFIYSIEKWKMFFDNYFEIWRNLEEFDLEIFNNFFETLFNINKSKELFETLTKLNTIIGKVTGYNNYKINAKFLVQLYWEMKEKENINNINIDLIKNIIKKNNYKLTNDIIYEDDNFKMVIVNHYQQLYHYGKKMKNCLQKYDFYEYLKIKGRLYYVYNKEIEEKYMLEIDYINGNIVIIQLLGYSNSEVEEEIKNNIQKILEKNRLLFIKNIKKEKKDNIQFNF